ncbi:MAG: 50S ribosomal protein L27 [Patescibacteria group bacterium]
MSHVKAGGSGASQHKQRSGKRLGLKVSGGQKIKIGQIIVRQRGSVYKAGKNVKLGRDFTAFSMIDGIVRFSKRFGRTVVNVE